MRPSDSQELSVDPLKAVAPRCELGHDTDQTGGRCTKTARGGAWPRSRRTARTSSQTRRRITTQSRLPDDPEHRYRHPVPADVAGRRRKVHRSLERGSRRSGPRRHDLRRARHRKILYRALRAAPPGRPKASRTISGGCSTWRRNEFDVVICNGLYRLGLERAIPRRGIAIAHGSICNYAEASRPGLSWPA